MVQYTDKATLVTEIESYKNSFCDRNGYLEDRETNGLTYDTLCELKDSIDNLEVKEVDLEKELDSMITPELKFHKALPSLFDVAKHFFELGLKVRKGE